MNQTEQSLASATDRRLAYCAGYFDGEGCIWVGVQNRRNYYLRMNVASADFETLLVFRDLFGGEVRPTNVSKSRKSIFHWSKDSTEVVETLTKLLPFMVAKRAEAQLVIDFGWELVERGARLSLEQVAKRVALWKALKEAKERGLKTSLSTSRHLALSQPSERLTDACGQPSFSI